MMREEEARKARIWNKMEQDGRRWSEMEDLQLVGLGEEQIPRS